MPPRCCALGGRLRRLRRPRRAGGWERGRGGPVLRAPGCRAAQELAGAETVTIRRPDDWHLHVRDGGGLKSVVPLSALHFGRAIIMPNLVPPVTTAELAVAYRDRILAAMPEKGFTPLMTLYLTDSTSPEDIDAGRAAGVAAVKLYPAGATTNSTSGVTDINKCLPTLRRMAEVGMPLLVHGEVVDPDIDIFDREKVFIQRVLTPLLERVPDLRVVMEHITTQEAAAFVSGAPDNVGATITPQHLLYNRNELFRGGIRPHFFCLPILKREVHRQALVELATSGAANVFLGTDSAPHPRHAKESACGCAGIFSAPVAVQAYAEVFSAVGRMEHFEKFCSLNGPAFYRMPPNEDTITLVRKPYKVVERYDFDDAEVLPICAGDELSWSIV